MLNKTLTNQYYSGGVRLEGGWRIGRFSLYTLNIFILSHFLFQNITFRIKEIKSKENGMH